MDSRQGENYDVFISYRRREASTAAKWLRRKLRHYQLPESLKEGRPRRLSVYMDEVYLRPDEDFWRDNLVPALEKTRYLVVVVTRNMLKSQPGGEPNWVQREIDFFFQLNEGKNIIFALAEGDFEIDLPTALAKQYPNPTLIDIRRTRRILNRVFNDRILEDQIRSICATLFEVSADLMPVLRQEDERRRRIRTSIVSTASLSVLVIVGYLLYLREEEANERLIVQAIAEERLVYSQASRLLTAAEQTSESDPTTALALGILSTELLLPEGDDGQRESNFRTLPTLRPFFERVLKRHPAVQILQVETRVEPVGPRVFPSRSFGVEKIGFLHGGDYLLIHHAADYSRQQTVGEKRAIVGVDVDLAIPGHVSIWNIRSGFVTSQLGTHDSPIKHVVVTGSGKDQLVSLDESGNLRRHLVDATGVLYETGYVQANLIGVAADPQGDDVFVWDDEGTIYRVNWKDGLREIATLGMTPAALAVSCSAGMLVAFHSDNSVAAYQLEDGKPKWVITSKLGFEPSPIFTSDWRKPSVHLHIMDRYSALAMFLDGDASAFEIVDISDGRSVFSKNMKGGAVAVSPTAGKVSISLNGGLEQFVLVKEEELGVEVDTSWNHDSLERDIGRARFLHYGPYGEYLLSSNAPIMQLVGPPPGLVKLFHANEFKDSRIKDVHWGIQIGSRSLPVLNGSFSSEGNRIALFGADGKVRIYDIFPEQAISPDQRSQDFFDGIHHLPVETRVIVREPTLPFNEVLRSIKQRYHTPCGRIPVASLNP